MASMMSVTSQYNKAIGRKSERGFTMVELAVSLMVIGLLVAAFLKGTELVDNARVNRVIRNISDYNAASAGFMAAYHALPGDLTNPGHHLPNCNTLPCTVSGNQNGVIHNGGSGCVGANPGQGCFEASNFFTHMRAAGLLSGAFRRTGTSSGNGVDIHTYSPTDMPYRSFDMMAIGHTSLTSPYWVNTALAAQMQNLPRKGHYYMLNLIPLMASEKIDFKLDDGNPFAGTVRIEDSSSVPQTGIVTRYRDVSGASLAPDVRLVIQADF